MAMEETIRSAWMKAGLKMSLGFFVVGAVLGIRIVSVERLDDSSKVAGDGPIAEAPPVDRLPVAEEATRERTEESSMRQAMTDMRERLPGLADAESRPGDRMVSCRLRGATQFMTADDCAMRGGRATIFESEH